MFTSWRKGRTHYPPCQQRAREIAVYWRTQASKRQARGPAQEPSTSSLGSYRFAHTISRFSETGSQTHYTAEDNLTSCLSLLSVDVALLIGHWCRWSPTQS